MNCRIRLMTNGVLLIKMYRRFWVIIFLIFAFETANAQDAERSSFSEVIAPLKSWLGQETATGNWNGLRDKLEDQGVTISSNFTTDIGGNPVGGLKKNTIYSGFLDVGVALDFEKIASLKGVALTVTNYLASGSDLSSGIGNFFGAQEIYAPGTYFFGEMDLSLSLLDDTLTLETGRLFAGDVFATSNLWQYYVNGGINDNLNSMPANIFFPSFNIAAWAVRTSYQPNKDWHLTAAIYNADTQVEKMEKYGADFSFDMDNGYLAIGQLVYKHNQSRDDKGLPGSTTFGSYYQSSRFQDLADSTRRWHGNYGFYLICDQMIYRGDWPEFKGRPYMRSDATYAERVKKPYHRRDAMAADRPKGLSVWAAGYFAPNDHINTQMYQITSGLVYQGLPPNRDRDVTAFCIILGKFSDKLDGQKIETVLELNHRFQVGQWFYITPDIQYVIRPNGRSDIDDALVLGLEISTNF
ncbi:carbohydrate porin [Candidatus Omnitrophota bacterium]